MKTLRTPEVTTNSLSTLKKFSKEFFSGIDTPVALGCYLRLKYEEYADLCDMVVKPEDYLCAYDFQQDYASVGFLKKYPHFPTTRNLEAEALDKFIWAESQCKMFNDGLEKHREVDPGNKPGVTLSSVLLVAQRYASRILGSLPSPQDISMAFGPGASSSCKGSDVSISDKLQSPIVVTRYAYATMLDHYSYQPWRVAAAAGIWPDASYCVPSSSSNVEFQDYNELMFVPKSSTSLRAICVEPNDMIYLQKGYGSYIRNRLRIAGLDLSNQQRINAEYARIGSLNGSFATIDLKSASDTISERIVWEVLPSEWHELLFKLTCRYTKLPDGRVIRNQKFSSMGNGFTFELETLLFYCLAKAAAEVNGQTNVQVYGDDIIVPTDSAKTVISVLTLCGFTTNTEKTFTSGPFRESCGSDWYLGTNVRPIFLKKELKDVFSIYGLANSIRRLARLFHGGGLCDSRLYRCWNFLTRLVPNNFRLYGPAFFGDQVFECNRNYAVQAGNVGGNVLVCTPVSKRRTLERYADSTQMGSLLSRTGANFALRGASTRCRIVDSRVSSHGFWSWNDGSWEHCL